MNCTEQLLTDIAEGLKNTEKKVLYFLDIKNHKVIKTTKDLAACLTKDCEVVAIDPLHKDLLEIMEDFALEQDTEEIQEHLLRTLKSRDKITAIENFKKTLYEYPRSKKNWHRIENGWLKEQASELLKDYSNVRSV